MPLISKTISNLIGGISQQEASIRLEGQCEDSLNGIMSLVEGWKKRKGTINIAKLYSGAVSGANFHGTDDYLIVTKNQNISVFDLNGNAKTVNIASGTDVAYLNSSRLKMTTVADTTFILNPDITTAMTSAVKTDGYANNPIINVKAVNWSTTYKILNSTGTVVASCTSPDGVVDPNKGSTQRTLTSINGIKIIYNGTGTPGVFIRNEYTETDPENGTTTTYSGLEVSGANLTYYMSATNANTKDLALAISSLGSTTFTANYISEQALSTGTYSDFSAAVNPEVTDADPKWLDFSYIAQNLASQISGASYKKNTIILPAGDYSVEDSQNGQYLVYIPHSVAVFSDLPLVAPNGYIVEITNGSSADSGNYWVKAVTKDSSAFGDCYWEECLAPNAVYHIDPATMPHVLLHNSDGTFTYKLGDWEDRDVGDDLTNPLPSFIGKKINDVFYYKNRLGFLADENAILSRASEPYAFFMSTIQTLADNEPIDAAASNPKLNYLKHAIPLMEHLYFFSDAAQFLLNEGDSLLSPKTASIDTATEYACDTSLAPVSSGRSIFFPAKNKNWESLYEGLVLDSTDKFTAVSVTGHVPALIPTNPVVLAVSPNAESLLMVSSENLSIGYLYKYSWLSNEKVQSSWGRLKFKGDVLNAWFVNTTLYLCIQYADGVYLEFTDFDDGNISETICLDRLIAGSAAAFTDNGSVTTITLPYSITPDDPPFVLLNTGILLAATYVSATTVTLNGIYKAADVEAIGFKFDAELVFSQISFTPNGQKVALTQGRLQLRHLYVMFANANYFKAIVTPLYRYPYTYQYQMMLGSGQAVIGKQYVDDGRFSIPVISRNTQVTIKITTNSIAQLCLISAGWEGYYVCRSTPS